jgi:hypothetical protein
MIIIDDQKCSAASANERFGRAPFSPRLPPADFFLSWSVKEELASFRLVYESLRNILEGGQHDHRQGDICHSLQAIVKLYLYTRRLYEEILKYKYVSISYHFHSSHAHFPLKIPTHLVAFLIVEQLYSSIY